MVMCYNFHSQVTMWLLYLSIDKTDINTWQRNLFSNVSVCLMVGRSCRVKVGQTCVLCVRGAWTCIFFSHCIFSVTLVVYLCLRVRVWACLACWQRHHSYFCLFVWHSRFILWPSSPSSVSSPYSGADSTTAPKPKQHLSGKVIHYTASGWRQ